MRSKIVSSCCGTRRSDADVVIVEVGGTVGDIEGEPFLVPFVVGCGKMSDDKMSFYLHNPPTPYLEPQKNSRPSNPQHSVKSFCASAFSTRCHSLPSDYPMSGGTTRKNTRLLFCNIIIEASRHCPLLTADTIYEVPLCARRSWPGEYLGERPGLKQQEPAMKEWRTGNDD